MTAASPIAATKIVIFLEYLCNFATFLQNSSQFSFLGAEILPLRSKTCPRDLLNAYIRDALEEKLEEAVAV